MNHYPQSPQSIGKVLDSGFSLYRDVFKRILPLSFAVALLSVLPGMWPYFIDPAAVAASGGLSGGMLTSLIAGFLVWFVIYMAVYAGWLKSLDAMARGGEGLGFGSALSAGIGKVFPLLVASILYGIAVIVGMLLLVVPGVILVISLMFWWFLLVLDDRGIIESLTGSHKLVWGNWWRTATVITVAGVLYMVALFLVVGIAGVIVGVSAFAPPSPEQAAAGPGVAVLVITAVQVLLTALLMPMMASIMLIQFRDLQLRKSGSDLAARAAAA